MIHFPCKHAYYNQQLGRGELASASDRHQQAGCPGAGAALTPTQHDGRICAEACEGDLVCAGRELASQIKHSHARSDFVGFTQEEEDGVSYRDNLQACRRCWQSCKEGLSWQGKPGNEMETLQNLDSSKIIFQKLTHRSLHREISQKLTQRNNLRYFTLSTEH